MFTTSKELTEVQKKLARATEELVDLKRSQENTLADNRSKTERERLDLEAKHRRELADKDHEIKALENKVARIESEMEARLDTQEEFFQREFDAKESALKIEYDARESARLLKEAASMQLAEAKAAKVIAEAEVKGTKIIQEALENVQIVYKNTLDLLTEKIANMTEIDISEIADLVRAATEGYPTLPDSISSTSSSK